MTEDGFSRERDRLPGMRQPRHIAIGGGWAGGSGNQGGGSLRGFSGRGEDDGPYDMFDRDLMQEEPMEKYRRYSGDRDAGRPYRGPDYGHGGSGRRYGSDRGIADEDPRGAAGGRRHPRGEGRAYDDHGGRMEGEHYRAYGAPEGQPVGRRGENYGRSGPEEDRTRDYEPDYLDWRRARIDEMDESYEAWRRERQSRFGEDFEKWRAGRASSGSASRA
jgi:hypothetical protein